MNNGVNVLKGHVIVYSGSKGKYYKIKVLILLKLKIKKIIKKYNKAKQNKNESNS